MLNFKTNLEPKISPTIALNQKVKELQAAGEAVINMSIGENRFLPPVELIDALKKYTDQVTYSDPQGLLELRKAIVKYYKDNGQIITEKHVVVSPGSKAGIFILMLALEGDLLLIKPSWVSYQPQAKHAGKQVFWIETKFENNYIPTTTEIKEAYKEAKNSGQNPKLIILNYPNNPTSYSPTSKELKNIIKTCEELGLTILSDELYSELTYDNNFISPSEIISENTIVIGGVSKFLSIAGLRIGWIITPQTEEGAKLAAILKALASDVWSNVSTNIQHAVADYLENGNYKNFVKDNKALHEQRNKLVYRELTKLEIEVIKPMGGFYVYSDFEKHRNKLQKLGVNNGSELQEYLLEKHKIAVLSGVNFGENEESLTLRMSTSFLDCNDSTQAKKLYEAYIKNNKKLFVSSKTHPQLYKVIHNLQEFIESI